MKIPKQTLNVLGIDISTTMINDQDYINITDMLKHKNGEFFVSDWLRNRNTVEFLSIWEEINNPDFNYGESAIIKSNAGLNSFKLSVKQRSDHTNAIGLISKPGRYGGTYAHKDIAFEFGLWISPRFKLYLIKEFQRLKEQEHHAMDRNVKRFLTKMNYKIHTDAIQDHLIPEQLTNQQKSYIYADEADLLNMAMFGTTSQQRKQLNPDLPGNIRDEATIEQLIVLANIESMNAEYIKLGLPHAQRIELLNQTAISQMKSLLSYSTPSLS